MGRLTGTFPEFIDFPGCGFVRPSTGVRVAVAVAVICLSIVENQGPVAAADFFKLSGHGGPIKGISIDASSDSGRILTASFDYSIGVWAPGSDDRGGTGPIWLEGHNAAVNTVRLVDSSTAVSGGDDTDVRLWDLESGSSRKLTGHRGKILSLDVAPAGDRVASASWDGTVGIWSVSGDDSPVFLADTGAAVNDVVFSDDGYSLYAASSDGHIRHWDLESRAVLRKLTEHGFGINLLILNETDGWLAYGAVDGGTRVIDIETAEVLADLTLDRRPILAMALSPDRSRLAVGDGDGFIMVVDTDDWSIAKDFRAARHGPVWALAFSADGESIYAGGIDDAMFAWPLAGSGTVELMAEGGRTFLLDPKQMTNGERQFNRKCSICHTLVGDGARRAGPSLAGVFGRKAGAVEGYSYTRSLKSTDIIWSENTISALFELGPDNYVPGTKMPMQRIARKQDRDDLIAFLKVATSVEADP